MNEFDQDFDLPSRETRPSDSGAGALQAEESPSHSTGADAPRALGNFAARESRNSPSSGAVVVTRSGCENFSTDADHAEAQRLANICDEYLRLMKSGEHSLRTAAAELGKSVSFFSGADCMLARYLRGGVAGLLRRRGTVGAKPGELAAWIERLAWFIPAAQFFYLLTNRDYKSGSVPEAIRRTISLPLVPVGWTNKYRLRLLAKMKLDALPVCPPELREALLQREKIGLPFVPDSIAKQITSRPSVVHQYRNGKNAALDYLCAPGEMRMISDYIGGEKRLARAGELIEMDDATINFPVCVPWTRGADECSRNHKVMVGRFQFLVSICAGTSYIPAWNYTARPRGSYRGEDVLSLMRIIGLQHGVPKRWRLERGVWKSNLVTGAIKKMGAHLDTVYSPHQKPFIEGLFNTLWTKLSVQFPGVDVGRFMGETEEVSQLIQACRTGAKDPRKYFPMLSTVLQVFGEVIAEKNRTPVTTKHHGRWVPEERWALELSQRKLDGASEWMFSPWVKRWKVKGMLVGGRIPMFEDMSVPFEFTAQWLVKFSGATVECHFDPAAPKCHATVVLAENFAGHKKGEVLGQAQQISSHAGYVRLVMGWGDDPENAGRDARQRTAAFMRREVRAVVPNGKGAATSEERDGIGMHTKIETGTVAKDEAKADEPVNRTTPEERAERTRVREEQFKNNPLDFV